MKKRKKKRVIPVVPKEDRSQLNEGISRGNKKVVTSQIRKWKFKKLKQENEKLKLRVETLEKMVESYLYK